MKTITIFYKKCNALSLYIAICLVVCLTANTQAQSRRYRSTHESDGTYMLRDNSEKRMLPYKFDTLIIRNHFIKGIINDSLVFYTSDLSPIPIPNIKQGYIYDIGKQGILEVLADDGPRYYNSVLDKTLTFPKRDYLPCGVVYSEKYKINTGTQKNKYSIEIKSGHFGITPNTLLLHLKGIPKGVDKISFLDNNNYCSKSINNTYNPYQNLLKITVNDKVGIYSYDQKKASIIKEPKKTEYYNDGQGRQIEIPKPILFSTKKGTVQLKEEVPIIFDDIILKPDDHLVYLYKEDKVGIFPHHTTVHYDNLEKRTKSFYKITKNRKNGWLDIITFKEYYNDQN